VSHLSDDELMVRGAKGDLDALRLLVERWERPVFAFVERMTGSREEAQDLTQEAFLRLCRNARRYRPSGRFKSWLFRIAGNLARSQIRRKEIIRWVPFELASHDLASPRVPMDRALETRGIRISVRAALLRLPARQRQAVLLWQYERLTYREIGEVMGLRANAVAQLLHRATSRLREMLSHEVIGE
jgi:RNA polymerase sigma-70 factor (ECF subfamily)